MIIERTFDVNAQRDGLAERSLHVMLPVIFATILVMATPSPEAAVPSTAVVIRDTGSTNVAGWTITVNRDGTTTVWDGQTLQHTRTPGALTAQLYADLARAGALAALPARFCLKSASFGSQTTMRYAGQTSPDLQCAQNPAERALRADAQALASRLGASRKPGNFRLLRRGT